MWGNPLLGQLNSWAHVSYNQGQTTNRGVGGVAIHLSLSTQTMQHRVGYLAKHSTYISSCRARLRIVSVRTCSPHNNHIVCLPLARKP